MFAGSNQHDSNEWLTYFCDNIHEDLNRVMKKPFVERPENKDGTFSDAEMSNIWWNDFLLKREKSILIDLFYG